MLEHIKKDYLTIKETFEILKGLGITKNEQVVRRWARGEVKGKKLKSTPPPKNATKIGYRIRKKDLESFIQQHTKLQEKSLIKETSNDEIQQLKDEISRLQKENESLQSQLEKKSNENSNEKSNKKNEVLFDDSIKEEYQESNDTEETLFNKEVQKKYQESIENFEDITEEKYERLIYTLASFFVEKKEDAKRIEQLEEENYELKLQADKIRTTPEQRKVLKGLGVSIDDILSHCSSKEEERVDRLEVLSADVDEIKVTFKYKGENYVALVSQKHASYLKEHMQWTIYIVKKIRTNRKMAKKKIQLIEYDVIRQTFNALYKKESNEKKPFQYLF
ncbi:hypothetical protein ABEY63_25615 [Priestia aryabhattai]|uniref:hypothetical protein n=1 Tax=Priestia aryabhattai TaxID=412384 RepID=UPI003D2C3636